MAAPLPVGMPVQLSNPFNNTFQQQVATSTSGDSVAAWVEYNGSTYSIWSARHTPGSGWAAARFHHTLDTQMSGLQLAIDAGGDASILWIKWNAPSVVWFDHARADGSPANPFILRNMTGQPNGLPVLDVHADGTAYAFWGEFNGGDNSGWAAVVGPAGSVTGPTRIDGGSRYVFERGVLPSASGAEFVWCDRNGSVANLTTSTYTPGSGWSAPSTFAPDVGVGCNKWAVGQDQAGNALVLFYNSLNDTILEFRRPAGGPWSGGTAVWNAESSSDYVFDLDADFHPDGSVLVMLRTEDFSGDSTTSGFTRSPSGQWEPPYSFARDLFSPGDFDGVALAGGGALVEFSPVNNSVYTLGLAQRPPAGCGGWESAPDAGVGNVSYGFAAARAGAGSVVLLFGQYAASTNRVMAAFVDVVASSAVPAPTVTYPPDGSNVSSPVAVVEGFTEPFFAVYAGGAVGQAGANGSFRVPVPLLSGANRLAVRAAPVGATCLSLATLLTLTFEDPVPGLVADLAKARADLDGALGALGAAQAQLDAAQARIDALSASGNATQAELDAALADLAAANETLQRMKGDFSRLTANLTATQEELDRVKVQFPWLEANLSAAQANVTAFKGEIVAVEAQLDASQAALAEADAEILLLKARDNQTTTLLQDATDNNAALSGQVTTLSIVAFIALLAAIAAIGLALVQGRRGGGGGGGSGVDSQNAGIATPGGSGEGGASSKKVEVRGWDPKKKEE